MEVLLAAVAKRRAQYRKPTHPAPRDQPPDYGEGVTLDLVVSHLPLVEQKGSDSPQGRSVLPMLHAQVQEGSR